MTISNDGCGTSQDRNLTGTVTFYRGSTSIGVGYFNPRLIAPGSSETVTKDYTYPGCTEDVTYDAGITGVTDVSDFRTSNDADVAYWPAQAKKPSPPHNSSGRWVSDKLEWDNPGGCPVIFSASIWAGDSSNPKTRRSNSTVSREEWDPCIREHYTDICADSGPSYSRNIGELAENTNFFWKVDLKNRNGTTSGPTWKFRTEERAGSVTDAGWD